MAGAAEGGSEEEAEEHVEGKSDEDKVEGAGPEEQQAKDEDLESDDHDGAEARTLPDPGEPTTSQVEDHRAAGHIPYRSWCRECVEGRGTGEQHRKRTGERAVCVFSFDYLFLDASGQKVARETLTETRDEVDLTILVARDSRGESLFGHVVPRKGVDQDHYAVDILMGDLK